nr:MAG: maturation protein [Leviviridae sp.]
MTVTGANVEPGEFSIAASESWKHGALSDHLYYNWSFSGHTAYFADPDSSYGEEKLRADNIARGKFVSKALEAQRQIMSGAFLGELRQTIHQIRRPAEGIQNFLSAHVQRVDKFRKKPKSRGRKTNMSDVHKAIGDSWLEAQFGIIPLIHDIDGAANGLAQLTTYRAPSKGVGGSGKSTSNSTSVVAYDQVKFNCIYDVRVERSSETVVRLHGAVALQNGLDPTLSSPAAEALGFKFRDFIPTVWELFPYSFFIDYFTNVGDIVDAFSFDHSSVMWAERGMLIQNLKKVRLDNIRFVEHGAGWIYESKVASSGVSKLSKFYKERVPYNASFLPSFQFSAPSIKQGLNIASLVASARGVGNLLLKDIFG